jgi:hypothetical protein
MFGSCSDFSGALYKADLERKLHRAVTCQGWGRGFKSLRPLQFFNALGDSAFAAQSVVAACVLLALQLEHRFKNPGNSAFKSALHGPWPVCAIGTALIFVFGSLLKTDERRSSVTLWDRSAQSQTPQKFYLPGKSRWRRASFASVPIGTACPNGKPNRPSSLSRCHGNF